MRLRARIVRFVTRHLNRGVGLRLRRYLPDADRSFDTQVEFRGIQVFVNTGEPPGNTLYWTGEYEDDQIDALTSLLRPGAVFFDVGANIGLYSLLAAQAGARVFAFEPSRKIRQRLMRNIGANGYESRITVIEDAVSNAVGTTDFYEGRPKAPGVGKIFKSGATQGQDGRYTVGTVTLDRIVESNDSPDLIKMDIEGAEVLALEGAVKLLAAQDAPDLLIEFHPGEIRELGGSLEECLGLLGECGYRPLDSTVSNSASEMQRQWYVFSKRGRNNVP